MDYKDYVREALQRLVGLPSDTPEPPTWLETRSSVATRLISCDGRESVLEMRHKTIPTLIQAIQVSLQLKRPLHWIPRDMWAVYWEFKDERWETKHTAQQSIAEAEREGESSHEE